MLERLRPLQEILTKHGVWHVLTETEEPGRIVYEDDFQVGVIPPVRGRGRPFPYGELSAPTAAGSKRQFGKRARATHPDR